MNQEQTASSIQLLDESKAQQLLESGVHFGQPVSKRSPSMDEYVYGVTRYGMQIIDLDQTWQQLQLAAKKIQKLTADDQNILFVGTEERAVSPLLTEYSEEHKLNYVTNRWLGGTLTNPVTRNRINHLRELESMEQTGLLDSFTPKERSFIIKKLRKLRRNLGGLKNIRGQVNALVIVDPMHELNATLEGLKRSSQITTIALADTNCNLRPEVFDVVVPCNVSSMNSLRQILDELVAAIQRGKQQAANRRTAQQQQRRQAATAQAPTRKPTVIRPLASGSNLNPGNKNPNARVAADGTTTATEAPKPNQPEQTANTKADQKS